jgi:hypothetical protein
MKTLDLLEERNHPKILSFYDAEKTDCFPLMNHTFMGFFTVARALTGQ